MRKWKVFLLVLSTVLMLGACGAEGGTETGEADPQTAGTVDESSWESAFAKAGFTDAEIDRYREVLETVGVTDYHDVTVVDNDPMTIVVGEIYDSSNLQVNVTLEDHEIIYIGLTGIPTRQAEPYFNWRGLPQHGLRRDHHLLVHLAHLVR